jgi:hypothetical protein
LVSVVAGPVLMLPRDGDVGPQPLTMVEVERPIGAAGTLKVGIGYAPRIDYGG